MSKRKAEKEKEKVIGFRYPSKIPSLEDAAKSIGKFENNVIPPEYVPNGNFDPLRVPTHEDDWLAQHEPDNQTFTSWHSRFITYKNTIQDKKIIYLLPIGKKEQVDELPSLPLLVEFCEAFFKGLVIRVMDPLYIETKNNISQIKLTSTGKRTRVYTLESRHSHPYDKHKMIKTHRQYCVHPLLDLCGVASPEDARCIVGVTMEDLYSDSTDSFTVGMASGPLTGVAIFSFSRYDPLFSSKHTLPSSPPSSSSSKRHKKATTKKKNAKEEGEKENTKEKDTEEKDKENKKGGEEENENKKELLERSCKVLSHEIGHMMGIAHCTYYECLMNGSGHLIEDFRQPLHMCPVDLKKLLCVLQVGALERYRDLLLFYEKMDFVSERDWIRQRIRFLESKCGSAINNNKNVVVIDD